MNGALFEDSSTTRPPQQTSELSPASNHPLHIPTAKRPPGYLANVNECNLIIPDTSLQTAVTTTNSVVSGVIRHPSGGTPTANTWNYSPDSHSTAAAVATVTNTATAFDQQYNQAALCRDSMAPGTYYNLSDPTRSVSDRKPLTFWPNKYEYPAPPTPVSDNVTCQPFAAQSWCNYSPYSSRHIDPHSVQNVSYLQADDGRRAMEAASYPTHDGYGLRGYGTDPTLPAAHYPPSK